MNRIGLIVFFLLSSYVSFAQPLPMQTDSMRLEKYRTEIGLDMSIPDFDTKTIDANVMGARLAGILDYMMENYNQSVYNRKLCQILKEQVEPLEKLEFELKKLKFVGATKTVTSSHSYSLHGQIRIRQVLNEQNWSSYLRTVFLTLKLRMIFSV